MPILVCPYCKEKYLPDWAKGFICWAIKESKKKGTNVFSAQMTIASQRRYEICKDINFKYDAMDCKCIPGLYRRLSKDGFFTPIFFNREVLHKYISFDKYRVTVHGNTYGSVFFANESCLSFGINRNKKVFCWLGDIEENVSKNEALYLLSENIESDHDVASGFYAGQIEAEFGEPSDEDRLLRERDAFDQSWNAKYSSKIFRYERNIYDLLDDLVRPVNWNKAGVMPVFKSLNGVCIESLCRSAIISAIKNKEAGFNAQTIGSLKLIEKLIIVSHPELDAKTIMMPFFTLYDFRTVLSHDYTKGEEQKKLDFCYERLGIPKNYVNFENLYDKLLEKMTESYSKITDSI